MPTFAFRKQAPEAAVVATVVVFAVKGEDQPELGTDAQALGRALDVNLDSELEALHYDAKLGAVARIPTRGKAKAPLALVVGLGSTPDAGALRKACGAAARAASKDEDLAVVVPGDLLSDDVGAAARAQAVTEGFALGSYAFTTYRTKAPEAPGLGEVVVLAGEGLKPAEIKNGISAGEVTSEAVCLTRDLVNEPPAGKRPPAFAEHARQLAKDAGCKVTIHDEKALIAGGFGGILGVGQGSDEPPRLVEVSHAPRGANRHVVLVGKGITFDTGGVSLKPTSGMATMKMDMAGAATALATVIAAARLGLKVKITALLPLAENMVSGDAYRVSDVLTHRGGKTVEVMNTDAEGRLVMADALAYGAESEPHAMVDIATLTGAQLVALGGKIAGLMGSDDELLAALEQAADQVDEGLWRLPLPEQYREHLDSDVADLKNTGKGREAGTIVAGLFLKEFTAGRSWAHLDIAGPAYDEKGDGKLEGKGGTGMGVRTLLRWLETQAA
ncbi:leucyl aminopeptidase [Egibacter rhizosphaerae]|uniref:Probable cytosol aminopeptidase n=1 Tax=Egibacter rhizosphaerae TaxID=1670831 RepID=A0A411YJB2_9ACTN|nr:leucyl aminopeptidase [Egibacter rhizosphaerae]QBI21209.1 leucyl aminopeptidase [Egibacter rhizosphaerae]